ncbi:serine O-acetyltransferase [Synechococcus sp. H60.2]|uniref:serine O-acetyltransferase n=1 Tax=Synechococcus sp. H60.2 TaxID=2964518 RepID=UPI0039C25938
MLTESSRASRTKSSRVSGTESLPSAVESPETGGSDSSSSAKPEPKLGFWQQFWEDIDCVFERDPAARNRWEVLFTYPGVHALFLHRIAHWLWQRRCFFLARLLSFISRSFTLIEIHPAARIGRRFFIDHGCGVVIGETAEIGDDVTLYHGVTLGGTSWTKGKRHPTLEDGVIVGTGAKILGPVRIGARARIGANAVVIQDVAPGMTVVGIPGRAVIPPHQRRIPAHGIDLDHHLMPDPVGRAIEQLLHRIQELEAQVARLSQERERAQPDGSGAGD